MVFQWEKRRVRDTVREEEEKESWCGQCVGVIRVLYSVTNDLVSWSWVRIV